MEQTTHQMLNCGIELACVELPARHVAALEFRFMAGTAHEPAEFLGLAKLVQETIELGTEKHDGRGLSDCFDEIGASHTSWVGRESSGYDSVVLPEFLERAVELHAEFLRTPTFPDDTIRVAIDLGKQELNALQDNSQSLADKLLDAQVYGPILGRHALGERHTLERITRQEVVDYWKAVHHAGRMQVAAAGAFDTGKLIDLLETHFAGFGSSEQAGRTTFDLTFEPKRIHHNKALEQQQIGIGYPGVAITDPDYAVQKVMLAVLSGGMSSRLFTEVREKLGLVYWVNAWGENPRNGGMIFLAASTTPERCDTTYATLLREVDRLSEDLTREELNRAATGLVAKMTTGGDLTRSRCGRLADDLFHYGHPVPFEEKIAKIKAVAVDDIHRYLSVHPRDELSVLTLGPRVLEGAQVANNGAVEGAKV